MNGYILLVYMQRRIDTGFTLMELLVTIAILGILAGLVTASLAGEKDDAQDAAVILSVESVEPYVTKQAFRRGSLSRSEICRNVRDQINLNDDYLKTWTTTTICAGNDADEEFEICCASSGREWIVWGRLSTYNDTAAAAEGTQKDIYCIDDDGFGGEVDLTAAAAAGGSGNFAVQGSNLKCE